MTYMLVGHTLAKYPTKRLLRARNIEQIAIGMGASSHRNLLDTWSTIYMIHDVHDWWLVNDIELDMKYLENKRAYDPHLAYFPFSIITW